MSRHHSPFAQVTTIVAAGDRVNPALLGIEAHINEHLPAIADEWELQWLQPEIACDIYHHTPLAQQDIAALRLTLGDADIITQATAHRRKTLLICDMDSTLIEQECIDELADYLGIKDKIATITERAMNGELDFAEALRERVGLLNGLPEPALQEVCDKQITLMPGATTLAATMKAHGAHMVIVSGGFTFFTVRVRDALGFHADVSNQLEIANSQLTGRVIEPIFGAQSKLDTLESLMVQRSILREETLAVGDGANDVPMLQAAGLGVAYHAKPFVQQKVAASITHNDLHALLYVQGYTKSEWVTN